MKRALGILFVLFLYNALVAQKNNLAFTGNREKSAQFEYVKEDFDSLFVYFFREPLAMAFCSEYSIDVSLLFTVDTSGGMSAMEFKNFDFKSPLHIAPNYETEQGRALLKSLRDSIRKVMYLTNGMWLPKLKEGVKSDSKVLVSTRIRKNNTSYLKDVTDTSIHDSKIPDGYGWMVLNTKRANPDFLYNSGVKHLNNYKYRLSKVYFEQALLIREDDIDAHYNLALCYDKLGNRKEACNQWYKCFLLGDKSVAGMIKENCAK